MNLGTATMAGLSSHNAAQMLDTNILYQQAAATVSPPLFIPLFRQVSQRKSAIEMLIISASLNLSFSCLLFFPMLIVADHH